MVDPATQAAMDACTGRAVHDVPRANLLTDRGTQLVLHRVQVDGCQAAGAPVLLAHGTFSNHRTCGGLARFLASRGHNCWLVDYEGHGCSNRTLPVADFETLFLSGTASVLQFIEQSLGGKCHWIGHSGGGLALLMALARQPQHTRLFHSISMLASQACDAGTQPAHRLALRAFLLMTSLIKVVPGRRLGLGPENELSPVMLQWYRWNLDGEWLGSDGFDYRKALRQHSFIPSLPILAMAGSGDRFIAPPEACRQLYALLPGENRIFMECGIKQGFLEDYSHGRLISSRSASREIWPRIADWLMEVEQQQLTVSC